MFHILAILIISLFILLYLNQTHDEFFSDNFYVSPSKIQGNGVFLNIEIDSGHTLFTVIDRNQQVIGLGKLINHCNRPNSKVIYDEKTGTWFLISIIKINKNDEITADYNHTPSFIKKPDPLWTC
jgi:SET domain-containing protein